MADKMARVAGRTNGGIAVPMLADADGSIGTTRKWSKSWISLQSPLEIRDTLTHYVDAYDVSNIPTFSLRIINRLGVPITLYLRTDVNATNGYTLADKDGVQHSITIQPTYSYVAITPEDWPILNYLRLLRISIVAQTAPESGVVEVALVPMR